MVYYLVMDEWNYPTNSGREFMGDYDTREEAEDVAKNEYENEYDNFLENLDGEIYNEACGRMLNHDLVCEGYVLRSTEPTLFFRSVIIEREVI